MDSEKKIHRSYLGVRLKPVARVAVLTIFPIKSCKGISLESAECTDMGLKSGKIKDRHFMVITNDGKKINARDEPTLLLVVPSFHDNEMWVDAPDMPTLKINLDDIEDRADDVHLTKIWDVEVGGVHCGSECANWFKEYLKRDDVMLIHHNSHVKPKYCVDKDLVKSLVTPEDKAAYADFSCYLLMNRASIFDLNNRITNIAGIANFRSNILTSGSPPYSEDSWKYVRIGDNAWFRNVKLCQRCTMIITDAETGIRDKQQEALSALLKYRKAKHIEPAFKQFDGEAALLGLHLTYDVGDRCQRTIIF
uniref:MOSC domain-containing protein n=1 Tax=Strigamia maritima TaxID=126957 RepID=T1IPF6_STRMM